MNHISITGRLTAAPTPRRAGDSLAAAFSVAVRRPFKDKNGEYLADFLNCVAFGKLGELALHYLAKGRMVGLTGRLEISKYTGTDGVSRQCVTIVADNIDFLDSSPAAAAPAAPAAVDDDYP